MPDAMITTIVITDLEVHYHLGVPDAEREQPQRLLITLEMEVEAGQATNRDELDLTVDYHKVAQRLIGFGRGRSWKLMETLAWDMASMIRKEFRVRGIALEIKKFILPECRHVSVRLRLPSGPDPA
jgi:7,8-dihydroneopterin aldolase/epimerase/oxygenase